MASEIHAFTELDRELRALCDGHDNWALDEHDRELLDQYDRKLRQSERRLAGGTMLVLSFIGGACLWAMLLFGIIDILWAIF